MKMLKKLLAVVLTGAMALTLLTACGSNAVTEKDIADAMNDMAKAAEEDITFTPRAKEREMAKAIAALSDEDLKELEESLKNSSLPEKAKEILGINAGGANANNFVWCGATYTDELGTSGQALNFMTQVMDKSANADKLRGKNPADDRYMGTALYKTVDENGKQVTKRIIVVTAEAVDE
jgi:hypothetical protein